MGDGNVFQGNLFAQIVPGLQRSIDGLDALFICGVLPLLGDRRRVHGAAELFWFKSLCGGSGFKGRMVVSIFFPKIQAWIPARRVVSFPADNQRRLIVCAVSWQTLQDDFGSCEATPLAHFNLNRHAIQSRAEALILEGRFESDGSILVRASSLHVPT